MGILDNAVSIANNITLSLGMQTSVLHEALLSVDGSGDRTYSPAVSRHAVVVKKQRLVKTPSGEMVMSQAYITFLTPTVIGLYDRITLPDGTTGPILNTEGFVASVNPILTEVYLG